MPSPMPLAPPVTIAVLPGVTTVRRCRCALTRAPPGTVYAIQASPTRQPLCSP